MMRREDRKNAIGIAFSGGGLQGIAHIGAIKALYELGIRPQYVSGTSSGAAMAAIIAMGFTAEEMTDVAKKYWKVLA
ncbi:MAG: patatin-like phospholipase family protein, partial [Ruminococcus sp.]|nr:patatin-like phospholipase family protein [Ruminococcus sp.]